MGQRLWTILPLSERWIITRGLHQLSSTIANGIATALVNINAFHPKPFYALLALGVLLCGLSSKGQTPVIRYVYNPNQVGHTINSGINALTQQEHSYSINPNIIPDSMPELQFPRRNPQWLSPLLARRDHNHAPPFIQY